MKLLRAGDLRNSVTLQRRVTGKDALGQSRATWEDVATVRASVEPLKGRELFAAGQTLAPVDMRVRTRYLSGVTAGMRLVWSGVAYGITAVINVDGLGHTLELMATSQLRDSQ